MKDRSLLFMCSDAGFSSAISNLPIKLIIVKFITMHLMDIIFFFFLSFEIVKITLTSQMITKTLKYLMSTKILILNFFCLNLSNWIHQIDKTSICPNQISMSFLQRVLFLSFIIFIFYLFLKNIKKVYCYKLEW